MEGAQNSTRGENAGSPRRVYRWLKILLLLTLAIVLILGALSIVGKALTRRLETETDPRSLAPWGSGTSFLSTSSGDVHILDVGEGDVILLVHGSTGALQIGRRALPTGSPSHTGSWLSIATASA